MDPSCGAYGRIWLFLADLNLVLGCLPAPTHYGPAAFNSFMSPQNPYQSSLDFHSQLSRKQPTHRLRAWKNTHSRFGRKRLEKACTTSKSCPVPIPSIQQSAHVYSRHKHQRPHEPSQQTSQSWSTNQHQTSQSPCKQTVKHAVYTYEQDPRWLEDLKGEPYTTECLDHEEPSAVDYPNDSAEDHSSLQLRPPGDSMIGDQETACGSDKLKDEVDQDEIEFVDRSDLDINADPDYLEQQPKPAFDLKNYSAEDVDNWASTLSAYEFEHLRVMGPNARTEFFRHDYSHYQPNDTDKNNSYQQQLNYQVDNSKSNFYDDLDAHNPQLEENLDGSVGFVAENGLNDGSGFDNGGFDNGGFDNGGFDNGGFDNGGFEDSGFDDGVFDDSSFDGGFDDGYGSTY
ncbi:uncharacterized protein PGTG_14199 [Puccinia graminis f. sp. tritici CRL 75-36-700-3]|uniref:Uncharacterized protein n=1 Tax=Puccinia graminis f. sp. tritici (strain CRL 75-36-700-3 / race SCCL) TaxID=418459 RepID=E3KWW7_PUCGT|nr:uncharacterized protein PGTG_14199 [Puccinia graminis f. sp. tritici CRL 75-36-700-3]EFP88860.2 hypothetical protein PGTG_14199 [Puccinia graminis f. sp. tritici CRL 75-36-700-3]